eukprot:gene34112-biopygen13346
MLAVVLQHFTGDECRIKAKHVPWPPVVHDVLKVRPKRRDQRRSSPEAPGATAQFARSAGINGAVLRLAVEKFSIASSCSSASSRSSSKATQPFAKPFTGGDVVSIGVTPRSQATGGRASSLKVEALFGFGKPKFDGPMICIDCGYIVQSGFNDLPRNYKCPQCLVGKNRFKPNESSTDYYNGLASQKAANKAAFRAKRAAARSGKGEERGESSETLYAILHILCLLCVEES